MFLHQLNLNVKVQSSLEIVEPVADQAQYVPFNLEIIGGDLPLSNGEVGPGVALPEDKVQTRYHPGDKSR